MSLGAIRPSTSPFSPTSRGTTGWWRWSSALPKAWTCTESSLPWGRRTPRPCSSATPQAEATDSQINALVCELYGVSDDEIAIVEG